jgi:hypothetical protein
VPDPGRAIELVIRAVADPTRLTATLSRTAAGTLNDGLPGTALLLAALSRADPTLARAAASHWDAAAPFLRGTAADGIYRGPGALATSLIIGSSYLPSAATRRSAVDHAVSWLAARARGLAEHQRRRRVAGHRGTPWGVYDAIKGLSGIGRILLAAQRSGHTTAGTGLAAALVTLTEMINAPGPLPGWWLPLPDHRLPVAGPPPPSGAATTGLAHGIAGPLALLSLAATAGHTVPGQREAIRTAATWLLRWSGPGPSWPPHIDGEALLRAPNAHHLAMIPGRRDAWCYGAAGIGTALSHAGRALGDPTLRRAGHAAVAAVLQRDADRWDTDGIGLCHGTAGVLQAAHRLGCRRLGNPTAFLTASLLSPAGHDNSAVPRKPGFLTGTSGAVLALADLHRLLPTPPSATWDAILFLR